MNTILDAFNAFVKIDVNTVPLIKTLVTSVNEVKKYVLKTERELSDALFKLAQAEKNLITDRLKALSEDDRKLDNVMKNLQLGQWSIGQMKGLREYDTTFYDNERSFVNAVNNAVEEEEDTTIDSDTTVDSDESFKKQNTMFNEEEDTELSDMRQMEEDWMNGSISDTLL
jgi:hypothetical protein